MRKKSYLTITDQFCGAGGSSQGAMLAKIKGLEISLALNHWKLAIETHQTNFPDAMHECTDISAADPRRYPSTDILITSPECTNHSLAKGKKQVRAQLELYEKGILDAAAERSRATMFDVCRFAEYHRYNIIIVENVVDARKWVMYDAWLMAMHALGYKHEVVYLNSMHAHPTPQSRDRMYVVFWKAKNRKPNLNFTPTAHCHKCSKDVASVQTWKKPNIRFGKYRQQYIYSCPSCAAHVEPYYYAAFNCINWGDTGTRIGDRTKPLSPNTVKRIEYGLKKYGNQRLLVHNFSPGYCTPLDKTTGTVTTSDQHALLSPFTVTSRYTSGVECRVKSIGDTIGTQPGDVSHGVVMPFVVLNEHSKVKPQVRKITDSVQTQATQQRMAVVMPFIIDGAYNYNKVNSVSEEFKTQTAQQGKGVCFIVENKGQSKTKGITEAAPCLTTKSHLGLISSDAFNSFIAAYYNGSNCTKHITEAIGSMTTNDRQLLVNYREPKLDDCYYRMLKSGEVGKAMAFNEEYVVLGNERDKVKQYGNAVTPPAMRDIIQRCVESLS